MRNLINAGMMNLYGITERDVIKGATSGMQWFTVGPEGLPICYSYPFEDQATQGFEYS